MFGMISGYLLDKSPLYRRRLERGFRLLSTLLLVDPGFLFALLSNVLELAEALQRFISGGFIGLEGFREELKR